MEAQFTRDPYDIPTTMVEISVSGRNLMKKDVLGQSDPVCIMYESPPDREVWTEVGRTEIIRKTLNPDFVHKFEKEYLFAELQKLKFELWDIDKFDKQEVLAKQDFLGSITCTLGEVVNASNGEGRRLERQLQGDHRSKDKSGTILLSAEEVSSCKDEITLQFSATKLEKKGKPDPFLVFSRTTGNEKSTAVHKTEVIKSDLNPTWKPFTVPVRALCNGHISRNIRVECYHSKSNGKHELIGWFDTSVGQLKEGPCVNNEYPLNHPKEKQKKDKKTPGMVKVMSAKLNTVNTFVDHIKGGMQLHCTIAVDFTSSNGDPRDPHSLHYSDPYNPNSYVRALRAVGEIIQDYDSDKLFPALGFGAKIPPNGQVSDEFFLNGHPTNPHCAGVEGVVQAYYQTLQRVQLHFPSNFAPIVNHVAKFASDAHAQKPGDNYFILLILTDGVIDDMSQTCDAIVKASNLPLSIIIIGVGNTDFTAMKILDADAEPLVSRGGTAVRDIVQFVPFRDFNDNHTMLTKHVLAEIPDQMMSYMKMYNVKPNPPRSLPTPSAPDGPPIVPRKSAVGASVAKKP